MVKKLGGSITISKLHRIVRNEIVSYDRFVNGDIKVIGLPDHPYSDCVVKTQFSFSEWIGTQDRWPVVKVERIESLVPIRKILKRFKPIDVHLFVSQKTGYSFKWHRDYVNVMLLVLKGSKKVFIKNKVYNLNSGDFVYIPKRSLHKVLSKKDTWALSIGY